MKKCEQKGNTTRRFRAIAETPLWSKGKSLERVSGSFEKPDDALWVNTVIKLIGISSNPIIDSSISVKVDALFWSFCKYDIILSAHIFMHLFRETSVLSNYLQTSGLDILIANRLILQDFRWHRKIVTQFWSSENRSR